MFVVFAAASNPYRLLGSVFEQTELVTFVGVETVVAVDPATAAWVSGIKAAAERNNWQTGTLLIDLTGGTPGAAVVLTAQPPTTSWLVGGYKGSDEYVRYALSQVDLRSLKSAWVLTAPGGLRSVSEEVLASVELPFPEGYILAGQMRTGHRDELQYLWKPQGTQ